MGGAICLLEVDIQGVEQICKTTLNPKYVFVFPPTFDDLKARLAARGSETAEQVETRLQTAKNELEKMDAADYADLKSINDDLSVAYPKFKQALLSYYPQLRK